ncbi:MAG: sugar phosphate isomerase/epimerase [Clostridia bacterium]|nr:sugar phosphate isomerase/epimerase [Clostridia bacterium]MBQ8340668.1 sugar phosphate isomerase/epimerase [Clostridia bacterium]
MKKGINIWSFPDMPLADVFALAKKAGFEGVEVALGLEGEISLSSTEADLLKVKKAADDCGIQLYSLSCGLYWDFWLNDDDAAVREKAKSIVKKQLETAKILGCDTILVIPGSVNADFAAPGKVVDYATTYERALAAINELKPYAEELGVAIGLENVWNKFLTSPMEMRDFIDKIDSPFVGSYFDVGNVVINGYPEHWIRILGNRIKKVHFKDFRRAVGTLDGFVDLLAGDVNYPEVVKALEEVGYDGWVSAEMIPNYKYHTETIIYNTSNAMDAILGR